MKIVLFMTFNKYIKGKKQERNFGEQRNCI